MNGFSPAGRGPFTTHGPARGTTHGPARGTARGTANGTARARCPVCAGPLGRAAGRGAFDPPVRDRGFCPRCRTPYSFAPPLRIGDLAGGYEIVECLGAGGPGPAGWVFLASDPGGAGGVPGRRVVLKSLRRAAPRTAARAGSHPLGQSQPDPPLRHRAIVSALGELRHADTIYAVMEFVPGPSLARLLRSRRQERGTASAPLPVPVAVAGALRLLSALEYVHDRGYVFCDLAPGNVVWNGDQVTLVDLQSVRRQGRHRGAFHVTAGFDAPELAVSPPSVGSDLYALGRLLATAVLDFPHRASTYRYALPAQEVNQVLARHEPLHRFLLRATAGDPTRRFAGAGEMAAALAESAGDGGSAGPGIPRQSSTQPAIRLPTREKGGHGADVPERVRTAGVLQTGLPAIHTGRADVDTGECSEITGVDAPHGSCHYSSRRPWI
ncbi:serine/threonine protein kinase [Frankia sp. EI5c]|uniref:protein kinase domain-containing protein n=1 Tax=Frankia sp. EI5c TaxID=683316 RepID=UPI0007C377FD|nr:protein kinase [Frankia sp. EI5c]OAA27006.1 serine/threonine protein kinase [Frankia sp. EI5c]